MTARDKFNSIITNNSKDINLLMRMWTIATIAMIVMIILLNVNFNDFIRLPLAIACVIPFLIILRIKKRMQKLECPKCNNKLDYMFLGRDYNPQRDFTSFPKEIKQCPYCKINLDDNIG